MPEHQQTQQSKGTQSSSQRQITPERYVRVSNPASIIQRARINPKSLTPADVLQLQRTIGNRAVGRLLSEIRRPTTVQQVPIQRQNLEEEEICPSCVQRQETPEEEEPLQGVFESKPEQAAYPSCIQRKELEEEESLQTKRENNTGMPDNLKAGVENLSGIDMSDVRVHYNSSKPSEVGALAYTLGTNIHVAPGQERHLAHEAWHVVQQKQGRVQSTTQMKGLGINDGPSLENEADMMGAKTAKFILTTDKEMLKGKVGEGVVLQQVGLNTKVVQKMDVSPEIVELMRKSDPGLLSFNKDSCLAKWKFITEPTLLEYEIHAHFRKFMEIRRFDGTEGRAIHVKLGNDYVNNAPNEPLEKCTAQLIIRIEDRRSDEDIADAARTVARDRDIEAAAARGPPSAPPRKPKKVFGISEPAPFVKEKKH